MLDLLLYLLVLFTDRDNETLKTQKIDAEYHRIAVTWYKR